MDVKEYIASGILESYSIGAVSPQEKQEVECMSHIYPEIRIELDKIMLSIEQLAEVQKIIPSPEVKNKLFNELKNQPSTAKIVSIKQKNNYASFNRLLAAACVVLAISMVTFYFYQASIEVDLNKQLEFSKDQNLQNKQVIESYRQQNIAMIDELTMFRDPNFKTVFLKGTNNKPESSLAIVCCNGVSKQTVIAIKDLPEPDSDKEYQLWAIVDGKPISLGMIPVDSISKGFFPVKNVENPQAFAITLEKKGGVAKPTMEEMYVMGEI